MTTRKPSSSVSPQIRLSRKADASPRYVWLHQCLLADISSGKYSVGSLLPTEEQLGNIYGVSRHTVREATRKLVDVGMISRHPSIGTVVRATKPAAPYVAALGSLKDLMDYTNTTRLEVLGETRIKADEQMARDMRCEVGSEWIELQTKRHLAGQDAPISFTKVYLRPEFAGIKEQLHGDHLSIYALLHKLYDQEVESVLQQIEATLMPTEAAKLLHLKADSPALRMLRSYFDKSGRLLTTSVNLYIADRFQLVTSWNKASPAPFD
ncbi:MAG: GntR family transcriptional regulator [Polaromonas sp.]|nr:GntR family transcriptional regulator [Polaromonas sp.]